MSDPTVSRMDESMYLPPNRPVKWPECTVDPVRRVIIGLLMLAAL